MLWWSNPKSLAHSGHKYDKLQNYHAVYCELESATDDELKRRAGENEVKELETIAQKLRRTKFNK
jgi:hypothetical protein